jgi:hypothetical protein
MSYLLSPVHEILAIIYGLIAILKTFIGYKLVVLNSAVIGYGMSWSRHISFRKASALFALKGTFSYPKKQSGMHMPPGNKRHR